MSALNVGVALFVLYGLVYVAIGALTPFMHDTSFGREMLIISARADAALFGGRPSDLLRESPQLSQLRSMLMQVIGGLLVSAGLLIGGVAYFALRVGAPWALALLATAGLAVLPFWMIVFRPYAAAGIALGIADLPPFMWVPAALLFPAIALALLRLREQP
jgi:hypothetical protein